MGGGGSTRPLSVRKFHYFVGCRLKFSTFVGCPLACERRRISGCHLSPPKITSANPSQQTISVT